jgi:hypothetical protein
MKYSFAYYFLLGLVLFSCSSSALEPEIEEPELIVNISVNGRNWSPEYITFSVIETDSTGTITLSARTKYWGASEKLGIHIGNIEFDWLPVSLYNFNNLQFPFRTSSAYTEPREGKPDAYWTSKKLVFTHLEYVEFKEENEAVYVSGNFRIKPFNYEETPQSLSIEGVFQNVRLFTDRSKMDLYLYQKYLSN